MKVEVEVLLVVADGLMLVAFKAESLLHAMAGMRLVLLAALFMVAAPLRCRAWACVLVLLFRLANLAFFGIFGLSLFIEIMYLMDFAFFDVVDFVTAVVVPPAWARCFASCRGFQLMLLIDLLMVGWTLVVGASIIVF